MLRAQFEANVFGWHDLTRRVIPAMRAQGEGRIVFCSSVLGLIAAPYRGAYCASKFAVEALADTLRMELAGSGIHVALIEPGPIATRFVEHAIEAYRRNVDLDASHHRDIYKTRIARMEEGGKQTFKLGPEAVAAKLVHALESKRPKFRYYVTLPELRRGSVTQDPARGRPRRRGQAELEFASRRRTLVPPKRYNP